MLGETDWQVALPLYLGHVCWTIVYDTIYAHQDKAFDVGAGVKSTALLFGSSTIPILSAFSVGFVSLICVSGWANGAGWMFYWISGVAPSVHLAYLLFRLEIHSPKACLRAFNLSAMTGCLVWLGCLTDYMMRSWS